MPGPSKLWVRIALLNLCIIAGLGALMRFKIGFEFPHFDQKYLQEAHSHFAFSGWITHCLMFLIVRVLITNLEKVRIGLYHGLIWTNLLTAYGMLIGFALQGYGPVSLAFSAISLLNGYFFSFFALRDLGQLPTDHPGKKWIQAAIWLSILSTAGTMILSHMMGVKNYDQDIYLGSVFFYLHFQYNGWFLFACIGLIFDYFKKLIIHKELGIRAFWLMFLSCIPAYFLSTLWAELPLWLYSIVVIAAFCQVTGWWYIIRFLRANLSAIKSLFTQPVLVLFYIVVLATTLKFLLQLVSTIPYISKLAFGFRPVVIAYLHLVLLIITTLFLLSFLLGTGHIRRNKMAITGVAVFAGVAILTEFVLMFQGIAGFSYEVIPLSKEILFVFALLLFGSATALFFSAIIKDKNDLNQPLP